MTIAEWCLFGAVILYLVTLAPVKALGHRDSTMPRPVTPPSTSSRHGSGRSERM